MVNTCSPHQGVTKSSYRLRHRPLWDRNGKIMPQQDIINTKTLVAVQRHVSCAIIWWSQSWRLNFIAEAEEIAHLHSRISYRIVHTPWNTTGRDYVYLFATLLSSHVCVHCLWLCSNKRKKLANRHGLQQNWCSLLCSICPLFWVKCISIRSHVPLPTLR